MQLDWPLQYPGRFLFLVVLYPIAEELVFRGLLQGWLLTRLPHHYAGISLANIIASVCFVAAHFWHHTGIWALAVFFPSLVFGFFRDRYGRTLPAILLHCFYNLGYFWLFYPA